MVCLERLKRLERLHVFVHLCGAFWVTEPRVNKDLHFGRSRHLLEYNCPGLAQKTFSNKTDPITPDTTTSIPFLHFCHGPPAPGNNVAMPSVLAGYNEEQWL